MAQHLEHRKSDWPRTLHGFGQRDESPQTGAWCESRFVPIGARVGRSGQVFETDGAAGSGPLVVKLFTWGAGLPEHVVQDFTREAMTVANLRHPHVAQVVDAGTLGDGTPFLVTERLAGMTLDELAAGVSPSIAQVLAILRGVGSALFAAHEVGVAHGAVRADNVFVADPAGYGRTWPKLMDFGVATLAAGARAIGRVVDEPPLEGPAPTRFELGRRAGERADQLALATLAWRLLRGMSAPAIERVLVRAMSPDPSQRFGTVAALVDALEEASVNAPVVAPAAPAAPASTAARFRIVAPPAGLASNPSSLTQQFFAEGEQLEAAHAAARAAGVVAVADEDEGGEQEEQEEQEEEELEIASPARLPRSRAQMAIAALLALGSVAIIGGTVASLASKPASGARVAEAAPAVAVPSSAARSPAVSSVAPQVRARAADRAPRSATVAVRRAARVEPPPFAALAKPSVAATNAPAPPPPPAVAAPPVEAAPPVVAAPPAEAASPAAAPPAGDHAAPPSGVVSAAAGDDGETQPDEQTEDEPRAAVPAPSTPGEAAPAPPAAP